MMNNLKPCPFCGANDIRYSVKTATSNFERIYHVAMYCYKCNCYGARVLIHPTERTRWDVQHNNQYRELAETAWNKRYEDAI